MPLPRSEKRLPASLADSFEEVCQRWLLHAADAASAGWWWGRVRERRDGGALRDVDRELEAVAVDDAGAVIAVGSCTWTQAPVDTDELTTLDALAAHLADDGPRPARYCFARRGFTPQLQAAADGDPDLRLVTPDELLGDPAWRSARESALSAARR